MKTVMKILQKRTLAFVLLTVIGLSASLMWRTHLFRPAPAEALLKPSGSYAALLAAVNNTTTEATSPAQSQPTSPTSSDPAVAIVNEAQRLAKKEKFAEAIATLDKIKPANDAEATTLSQVRNRWSDEILKQATTKFQNGDVTEAIDTAETIPANTTAQKQYAQLRRSWFKDEAVLQLTEVFHKQRRCTTALTTLDQLTDPTLRSTARVQTLRTAIIAMRNANQNSVQ